jgi:hypothetical protein
VPVPDWLTERARRGAGAINEAKEERAKDVATEPEDNRGELGMRGMVRDVSEWEWIDLAKHHEGASDDQQGAQRFATFHDPVPEHDRLTPGQFAYLRSALGASLTQDAAVVADPSDLQEPARA